MSKLVLFLFLGVCVMAVHMMPVDEDDSDDAALEALVNSLEPELKEKFLEEDPRVNWKKVWKKAKPILIQVGKVAAGAAVAGAIGG